MKRNDFSFDIVKYLHLSDDLHCVTSYGLYISHLVWFARTCNELTDYHERNKIVTERRRDSAITNCVKPFPNFSIVYPTLHTLYFMEM